MFESRASITVAEKVMISVNHAFHMAPWWNVLCEKAENMFMFYASLLPQNVHHLALNQSERERKHVQVQLTLG